MSYICDWAQNCQVPGLLHAMRALHKEATALYLSTDVVFAQEESQQVALGGDTDRKSSDALKQLAKLAAAKGAKVGVDLTWAWLDGKNPDFPDFKQMQVQRMCHVNMYLDPTSQQMHGACPPALLDVHAFAYHALRGTAGTTTVSIL